MEIDGGMLFTKKWVCPPPFFFGYHIYIAAQYQKMNCSREFTQSNGYYQWILYLRKIASYLRKIASYLRKIASYLRKIASYLRKIASYLGKIASYLRKIASYLGKIASYLGKIVS
jgi:energy-converting hydrogenase Eha subunit F